MTAQLIAYVLIAFAITSPANLLTREADKFICERAVGHNQSYQVSYRENYSYSCIRSWTLICYDERTVYKIKYAIRTVKEKRCCDGYKNTSGTCEPQCSPACGVGRYCAEPNKCKCDEGWDGVLCDAPLFCVLAKSLDVKLPISACNESRKSNYTEDVLERRKIRIKEMNNTCRPECYDQLNSTVHNFTRSEDTIYYFLPKDASCNVISEQVTFMRKYGIFVWIAIGILLIAMILNGVDVVRRKWRSKKNTESKLTQYPLDECMVENEIYSSGKPAAL